MMQDLLAGHIDLTFTHSRLALGSQSDMPMPQAFPAPRAFQSIAPNRKWNAPGKPDLSAATAPFDASANHQR
jgi:hypothetical protein